MPAPARSLRAALLVALLAPTCTGRRTEVLASAGEGAEQVRLVLQRQTNRSGSSHAAFAPSCDTYTVDEVFLEVPGASRKVWWDHDPGLEYEIAIEAPGRFAVRRGRGPWATYTSAGERLEPVAGRDDRESPSPRQARE
ncbi:hypothetical protein [Nannocystis punicea]|uniref:Uncharacterized protein n=1 Tax=Nannocystis punicea TaxID=2995304 RepID=A0ABY7GVC1_9BACT|nr:hypothetical protein [Nannocystis poenicansa]WAS90887.1 hypothetical protein O0S08_32260 [Nannocystis poenicansa]